MKYNIGDMVRVINCTDHRKQYNGETFTITSINPNGFMPLGEHYGVSGSCPYIFYTNELALVESRSITINVYDNKTVAKLLYGDKVVKTAIAKCNPEDEFDFEVGAKIAFDRLFNNVKEVSRRAKVGEYIKVVKECHTSYSEGKYTNGDIGKVVKVSDNTEAMFNGKKAPLYDHEYVVLENYKPENSEKPTERKEPQFKVGDKVEVTGNNGNGIYNYCEIGETVIVEAVNWKNNGKFYCYCCKWGDYHQYVAESNLKLASKLYNGKVVCINNDKNFSLYTVGKIYEFKDGQLINDSGDPQPTFKKMNSFEEWNKWSSADWIEVVE